MNVEINKPNYLEKITVELEKAQEILASILGLSWDDIQKLVQKNEPDEQITDDMLTPQDLRNIFKQQLGAHRQRHLINIDEDLAKLKQDFKRLIIHLFVRLLELKSNWLC